MDKFLFHFPEFYHRGKSITDTPSYPLEIQAFIASTHGAHIKWSAKYDNPVGDQKILKYIFSIKEGKPTQY